MINYFIAPFELKKILFIQIIKPIINYHANIIEWYSKQKKEFIKVFG